MSACTRSDSCIALGTTGSSTSPTSIGQYRETDGTWSSLVVPDAPSSLLTTAACVTTTCLIGGVQPSGNLIWSYNASSQSVSIATAPPGGVGIRALSCFQASRCAAVYTGASSSVARLSFTSTLATRWEKATSLDWSVGDTIDDIACTNDLDCLVSATSSGDALTLEVTRDAGHIWRRHVVPRAWTNLASLYCEGRQCVAIATTKSAALLVRSENFGRTWRRASLDATPSALACTSINSCVIVGSTTAHAAWFAVVRGSQVRVATLRYVPTAFLDVSCGSRVCVANGVSTVLSFRP